MPTFLKGAFFNLAFSRDGLGSISVSTQPGSIRLQMQCYHPKGKPKQTLCFDLGLHKDYLHSLSYPHAPAENMK